VLRGLARLFGVRDPEFFDMFEAAGENAVRAAELLDRLFATYPDEPHLARQIVDCEHEGDRIAREIIDRLNHTFVTPIDREDILQLTSALDDIVDLTEEAADYLGLYRIEAPMGQAAELTAVLVAATRQLVAALPHIRSAQDIRAYTVEMHRLENEGDRIARGAIAALFAHGIDPMFVIRWKDIFERLEDAIDACERAADILEGIVIKNA
jgi:uncharacterized protein